MKDRQVYIDYFFYLIKKEPYVLLKHTGKIGGTSDLDILFEKKHCSRLLPILLKQSCIEKHQLLRENEQWQLFLYFKDDSFLQIDFLFGFFRKELIYLSTEEVQRTAVIDAAGRRTYNWCYLAEHLLLFNYLNYAPIPEKYLNFFTRLDPVFQDQIEQHLQQRFGFKNLSLQTLKTFDSEIHQKIIGVLCQRPENNRLLRFWRKGKHYWNRLNLLWRQRGMTISFSGVDGAGKSTIIEKVKDILSEKYRRKVVVLRHRPSLIPILSAYRYGKSIAENRAANRLPRQGRNRSFWNSLFRFTYYYLDYFLGQFYVFVRYHLRSYIVLYDRYYFDFIVDSRRSNIEINDRLPRFLYRFIHKPQLNLFLYANPELIRQRKQELPKEAIQDLTLKYKTLFEELKEEKGKDSALYLSIENNDMQQTLTTIFQYYKKIAV